MVYRADKKMEESMNNQEPFDETGRAAGLAFLVLIVAGVLGAIVLALIFGG